MKSYKTALGAALLYVAGNNYVLLTTADGADNEPVPTIFADKAAALVAWRATVQLLTI